MNRFSLFLIFLILGAQATSAQALITIDIHANGDAIWTMEKRMPLTNQTDVDEWEDFIQTAQTENQQDILDFSKRMEWFLTSAGKLAGRPMKAENFNILYETAKSPSNSYGIIRYSFNWSNFSRMETGKILIGDSFSEGMVLSQDNVLIINIPEGYEVESASPVFDKRDGVRLIWDGTLYRNFNRGEPGIVLKYSDKGQWLYIVILLVMISGVSIILLRNKKIKQPQKDPVLDIDNLKLDDLKYEELIESFLASSGGEAPQSNIIKEIGLSKSRISTLLSHMKDKGKIIKIKNGKGNLIRIVSK